MIKMIFSKKQIVGIIGTLLTMIGVFLPAFSMNTFDDLTLFNHGKGDGVIILGVCSFALILLLFRKFIVWEIEVKKIANYVNLLFKGG